MIRIRSAASVINSTQRFRLGKLGHAPSHGLFASLRVPEWSVSGSTGETESFAAAARTIAFGLVIPSGARDDPQRYDNHHARLRALSSAYRRHTGYSVATT